MNIHKLAPYIVTVAATLVIILVIGVAVVWFTYSDPCTSKAREAALSSDTKEMLAGGLSLSETIDREDERITACGN